MNQLLWVGLGGLVGSVSRYLVSGAMHRLMPFATFPVGTLAVNVVGCFLIGFLAVWFEGRHALEPNLRLFLFVGILGGFTTYSTFGYETMALAGTASFFRAALNVIAHLGFGLCGVWLGSTLARTL